MSSAPSWSAHLVAHRGESADYPENTLLAMRSALQAGGNFLECDIQLSRDRQAMVIHDSRMGRTTTNQQGRVWDYTAQQLQEIGAGYPERFSEKFSDQRIPRLSALVDLLVAWPQAHIFVELKRASLSQFGSEAMFDAVLPALQAIQGRYTLISYDYEALYQLKTHYQQAIGWVSDTIDSAVMTQANQLQPNFLITDADTLKREFIEQKANWRWMLFEVNDPEVAQQWLAAGVEFIETNRVKNYLPAR